MQHREIFRILEAFAPLNLAVPGDNCGLQIGNKNDLTKGVLLCVDITRDVIKKSIARRANLIISHHPITQDAGGGIKPGSLLWEIISPAIKNNITLCAYHTNFDVAEGGINDWLANLFGLQNTRVLQPTFLEKTYKLVVYVPQDALEKVRAAVCGAGAGKIGDYSGCTFLTHGIGTFVPGKNAKPAVGKKGQINRVGEARLETVVIKSRLPAVIAALKKVHPYEEPAYDIYPLQNQGKVLGLGRVGTLPQTISFTHFCSLVNKKIKPKDLIVQGQGKVKKVALSSGSGKGVIEDAIKSGADTFLTGELNHHTRLLAKEFGLNTVEAGHYESEVCFIEIVAGILKETGIKLIE
ncbi:MAG: Nif3-like dinuclear metal center hexameric protein [Candidatus Margulisiibacteriota bacterium]